jgi:hypothetical protein
MNDQKILKLRTNFENAKGYGMYWMFLESMARSSNGMIDGSAIAELQLSYGIATEELLTFIEYCVSIDLFKRDENGYIYTPRMLEHLAFRKERSESGRRGALSKWGKDGSANDSAIGSVNEQLMARKKEKKERKETNEIHKPTAEQVSEYCREKGYKIDAPYFIDYYETRGWMIGKNKIKSWKACIRTWVRRAKDNGEGKKINWINQ